MGLYIEKSSDSFFPHTSPEVKDDPKKSSLVSRNVTVFGRRTSIRLEPEMWEALKYVSRSEKCTIHNLCTLVYLRKKANTSLTAAIRVFLMLYFRAATTEDGHKKAGHGNFERMKRRARIPSHMDEYFGPAKNGAARQGQASRGGDENYVA